MKLMRTLFAFFCLCSVAPSAVMAQSYGSDMVTNEMAINGLFIPHRNFCYSTEAFVQVGSNPNKGFCIEKNLRASGATATWDVARQACAADDKRLPEPSEFTIACNAAPSGLSDMTSAWQWSSNFNWGEIEWWGGGYLEQRHAWASGGGVEGCASGKSAYFQAYSYTGTPLGPNVNKYRCVR